MLLILIVGLIATLALWGLIYRLAVYWRDAHSVKAGMSLTTEMEIIAPPPLAAFQLFRRMTIISVVILILWSMIAFWLSQEQKDSFFIIFLRPFINPLANGLIAVAVRIGLWLAVASICICIWLWIAVRRTGGRRVVKHMKHFGKSGKKQTVVFTEPQANAWPPDFADALPRPNAHVAWRNGREIVVEIPPFDRPPVSYGASVEDDMQNLLTGPEDNHA
ncbi:hypothetical protein CCAX7_46180 [Capsulimonas corticalis]|uniref:Uncharacterized protein n=1 Tax=Capsulimonas corticalis TaxID=2219043 RepID=A0A402D548_9BACT|nr:hypothetical protein [Capsulimonas corticalis]BDI32567.1 hypothetical protein CCAX7_46180 [Capsulimonas corticalis]